METKAFCLANSLVRQTFYLLAEMAGEYEQEVRAAQGRFKTLGINGVPAFILNNKFLVEGAQPVEQLAAAIQQAAKRAREDEPSESL